MLKPTSERIFAGDFMGLRAEQVKARHYEADFLVPLSFDPVLGAIFSLDALEQLLIAKENHYYVMDSYSFSCDIAENIFQDALNTAFKFQIVSDAENRFLLPDSYKANQYLRQFDLRQAFSAHKRKPLFLKGTGIINQSANLAAVSEIKVLVNFILYEIGDQAMKSVQLGS